MKEFILNENESGQRFDKYLKKRLPNATTSFLYKMLRKKNITLNDKKASGNEKLQVHDHVKIFLSDETYMKFATNNESLKKEFEELKALSTKRLKIVYEDEDMLVINKPDNMLSQKAKSEDISANELILAYLIQSQFLTYEMFQTFRPSVCNRLDRNTTGLLIAGKTMTGLQQLSDSIRSREIKKFYRCIVHGELTNHGKIKGWLKKDDKTNKVTIYGSQVEDSQYIETDYRPLKSVHNCTLLEIHLITGRTHQIRAHLSSIGHPIIGDYKYGFTDINKQYLTQYHVKNQLLHAYRLEFPDGKTLVAEEPVVFNRIINEIKG